MPNPRGNLAGWADPSKPGWEDRLKERVQARQRKTKRASTRTNGMYLFFDDPYRLLLDEAAHRRDISMAGYGRRAIASFIAHDLDMPFEEVIHHAAQPSGYLGRMEGRRSKTHDDGVGHGLWIIEGLIEP